MDNLGAAGWGMGGTKGISSLFKNTKRERKNWITMFLKSHLNMSCLSKALLPVNRSWVSSFNNILLVRVTTKLSAARKRKKEKKRPQLLETTQVFPLWNTLINIVQLAPCWCYHVWELWQAFKQSQQNLYLEAALRFSCKAQKRNGSDNKRGRMVPCLRVSANRAAVSDFAVKTLRIVVSRNAAVSVPPCAPPRVHALMCLTFSQVCWHVQK